MKGKTLSAMGILAIAAGVLLAIFCVSVTTKRVVIAAGILFGVAGLANLIFTSRRQQISAIGRTLTQIANAAAVIFGVCLIVFCDTFMPLVTFIFGIFVGVCALWQFFVLAIGCRPHQLPAWLYVFPLAVAAGTIAIFLCKGRPDSDHLVMLLSGIFIAVTGVGSVIEGSFLGNARRKLMHAQAAAAAESEPQEVKAKEIASETPKIEEKVAEEGQKEEKTQE